jgi:hypothetical protein
VIHSQVFTRFFAQRVFTLLPIPNELRDGCTDSIVARSRARFASAIASCMNFFLRFVGLRKHFPTLPRSQPFNTPC